MALPKGSRLLAVFNDIIEGFKLDGTLLALEEKWF
jgi:ABC-type amino acid transport substrate-binding protein